MAPSPPDSLHHTAPGGSRPDACMAVLQSLLIPSPDSCEKVSILAYTHTLGLYHPPSRCGAHESKAFGDSRSLAPHTALTPTPELVRTGPRAGRGAHSHPPGAPGGLSKRPGRLFVRVRPGRQAGNKPGRLPRPLRGFPRRHAGACHRI